MDGLPTGAEETKGQTQVLIRIASPFDKHSSHTPANCEAGRVHLAQQQSIYLALNFD